MSSCFLLRKVYNVEKLRKVLDFVKTTLRRKGIALLLTMVMAFLCVSCSGNPSENSSMSETLSSSESGSDSSSQQSDADSSDASSVLSQTEEENDSGETNTADSTTKPTEKPTPKPTAKPTSKPQDSVSSETYVPPAASQGRYVGSSESNKYHNPSCRYVKKILPENKIWFDSAADAEAQGYSPCGVCNP